MSIVPPSKIDSRSKIPSEWMWFVFAKWTRIPVSVIVLIEFVQKYTITAAIKLVEFETRERAHFTLDLSTRVNSDWNWLLFPLITLVFSRIEGSSWKNTSLSYLSVYKSHSLKRSYKGRRRGLNVKHFAFPIFPVSRWFIWNASLNWQYLILINVYSLRRLK